MADLFSDYLRLASIWSHGLPDIDKNDIWNATIICKKKGTHQTWENEIEHDLNPVEPIERVSEALIVHVNALVESKVNGVGAPSRHGGAVPTSTINYMAWEMLVMCHEDGIAPPVALLNLIHSQLGIRSNRHALEEQELVAKMNEASIFSYLNPDASFREIAKRFEIDVATVSRWNKELDLRTRGEILHQLNEINDLKHNVRSTSNRNKIGINEKR